MRQLIFCYFITIMAGCASVKCAENDNFQKLGSYFKEQKNLVEKGGEKEFKLKLLSKICGRISDKKKILIVEDISNFGIVREGLVYIYDDSSMIFYKKEDLDAPLVLTEKGDSTLLKVASLVKSNVEQNANALKEKYRGMVIHDAPLLQIILFDSAAEPAIRSFDFAYDSDMIK